MKKDSSAKKSSAKKSSTKKSTSSKSVKRGKAFQSFIADFEKHLRTVPNFPKDGIMFKDITTVLKNKKLFERTAKELYKIYKGKKIDKVVGIESRGFMFGATLAYKLGAGFVPVRKPSKLPAKKISASYELEYGTNTLEIHADAIKKGERVLIHDDLLATGGTAAAACQLVEELGGEIVGVCFLIELEFLNGRQKLGKRDVVSLLNIS
jgi:adenine phosphoribosyltransferase